MPVLRALRDETEETAALILERNKLVARKVARLFLSVGATAQVVEDPTALLLE